MDIPEQPNNGNPTVGGSLNPSTIKVDNVHGKLDQDVVQITVDKLSLILHKHSKDIEKRKSWVAPLGVLLTFLISFLSTDFKDNIFKADTWKAIFVMSSAISAAWLIYESSAAYKSKSIEDLVEKIKKQD